MKKILYFVGVAVMTLALSSCSDSITKKSVYCGKMVTITPTESALDADLDVRRAKVTGMYSETFDEEESARLRGRYEEQTYERLKKAAVYNALEPDEADVLVAPLYKVVTNREDKVITITVTVSGYPAFYTNIHVAEEVDGEGAPAAPAHAAAPAGEPAKCHGAAPIILTNAHITADIAGQQACVVGDGRVAAGEKPACHKGKCEKRKCDKRKCGRK